MSYTDIELQNLSRSKNLLVRTIAARYYVERDNLRIKLAEAKKKRDEWKCCADSAEKQRTELKVGYDKVGKREHILKEFAEALTTLKRCANTSGQVRRMARETLDEAYKE